MARPRISGPLMWVLLMGLMDLWISYKTGMAMESNPVALLIQERWGFEALVRFKVVTLLLAEFALVGVWIKNPHMGRGVAIALGAVLMVVVMWGLVGLWR